jgi:hypothetical protein
LLPDQTATLSHDEGAGVLSVISGSHASKLNVYSAEDFPRLASGSRAATFAWIVASDARGRFNCFASHRRAKRPSKALGV